MPDHTILKRGALLLLAGLIGLAGWMVWRCQRDPAIRFLPESGPAAWIGYPMVPDIAAHGVADSSNAPTAIFRRSFVVSTTPARAEIRIRALENFQFQCNQKPVTPAVAPGPNWKDAVELNLAGELRPGTNQLEVIVRNTAGPPLLWLVLEADGQRIVSDSSWEVSLANASWQPARVAGNSNPFKAGNPMRSDTGLAGSIRREWRMHLTLLGLAVVLALLARDWLDKRRATFTASEMSLLVPGALMLIWVGLALHNNSLLAPISGFDIQQHLRYIKHVQTEHALPPAGAGWETHQPPLYYLVAALLLQTLGLDAAASSGLTALRLLSLLFGLGQIALVLASLRLLFPGELKRPLLGTAMAALLPAHLYHAHYVTNETLLALLVSGVFYLSLRVLRAEQPHWAWSAGLGACLGAALLTKLSALVVAPLVIAALALRLLARRECKLKPWASSVLLPAAVCLLVSGWFYWGLWSNGGDEAASRFGYGTGWWQQDGYRTAGYYLRFGESLVRPLFSSFHSYWDGMYSTLWGDGLCGGSVSVELRPPWNYDLLAVGFVLALLPTLALVTGGAAAGRELIRKPSPAWLLLLGAGLLFVPASIWFSLKAPGASQVRASFGLMLLVPFCALFARGCEHLSRRAGRLGLAVNILLLWWGLNSLFAHWIPGSSAQSRQVRATVLMRTQQPEEAVRIAEEGLRRDPSRGLLRSLVADAWKQTGRTNESRQLLAQALEKFPDDPMAHFDAALDAAEGGRIDEAVLRLRHAQTVGPDSPLPGRQLVLLLSRQGRLDEALAACREALHVRPFDPKLQEWFAELARGQRPADAAAH